MKTRKIYQKDPYIREFASKVAAVSGKLLATESTIFFPTGGGQSCDLGYIAKDGELIRVREVYESAGVVWCECEKDLTDFLKAGDDVIMEIDWERRWDNMQRHLGEHILSGTIYKMFGGENKGFHMGDDAITIDIAFPKYLEDEGSKGFNRITWDMAMEAEREANSVIQKDLPVTTDYFNYKSEAEQLPLRKKLTVERDISVVTVGSYDDPADCVACCGTHPVSTGQVGLLKIYKIEPNKGMTRITFDCGKRAVDAYRTQFDILYDLSNRMSSGFDDILHNYDVQLAKTEQILDQLKMLRKRVLDAEVDNISSAIENLDAYHFEGKDMDLIRVPVFRYVDFSVDDLQAIVKDLLNKYARPDAPTIQNSLVALVCQPAKTVLLLDVWRREDCGKIVKEKALPLGGKGGGKPETARVFFEDAKALDQFLQTL